MRFLPHAGNSTILKQLHHNHKKTAHVAAALQVMSTVLMAVPIWSFYISKINRLPCHAYIPSCLSVGDAL